MIRWIFIAEFVSGLLLLFPFITSCEANLKIEKDTITIGWPVCEYKTGEDVFYNWACREHRVLSDVDVCLYDRSNIHRSDIRCVKSTDCFSIDLVPKNRKVMLSLKKPDYVSRLIAVQTGQTDLYACNDDSERNKFDTFRAFMFPPMTRSYTGADEHIINGKSEDCDVKIENSISPNSNYGEIVAIALEFPFRSDDYPEEGLPKLPVEDAVVSIIPVSSGGTAREPIYTNNKGVPCYSAKSRNRRMGDGFAIFTRLKPGDYHVKYTVPNNYFCIIASIMADRMLWGYRTETPNQTRVPVQKGHSTITTLKCYNTDNYDAGTIDLYVSENSSSTDSGLGSREKYVLDNDASSDRI
ncbi:MAG: hypothetical protein JXA30_02505 [Deltaproteobacteria bacterium]|nr:hypothetical protein [Deltaproteobacteria bacterium]